MRSSCRGKLRLDRSTYIATQTIYYPGIRAVEGAAGLILTLIALRELLWR
jgi:hypothetical protein